MAVHQDEQFTFVAGLNSEAGYFTFPKNTWKDGDNLIPNTSGVLSKRVAVDLEESYSVTTRNISSSDLNLWAFTSHKWLAVAGNGDTNFIVAQCGRYVYFYDDTPIQTSGTVKAHVIDLNTYKAVGNPSTIGTAPIKTTNAGGKLIITSRDTDPILVTYDPSGATFSESTITVEIRDFKGVDDSLDVDEKPASLSDEHKYNLYNQGWTDTNINAYFAAKAVYPSNTQSWIYGKDSSDNFDSNLLDKQDFGTSPAPKGRYVLNAFYEDRATASGIVGLPIVSEDYRPSVCAFFAGRAWYGGTQSSRLGAAIFFSQVSTEDGKLGKCYQDADPTSEVLSDLVDTDGGVIYIQDCGQVVDVLSNDNGVMVLATNGVWFIVGTSTGGFTATGYEVKKLSSFGCVGRQTVVEAEDTIYFWSFSSICRIGRDQVGATTVVPITELNIKSIYRDIPPLAKRYASGGYNGSAVTVYWLWGRDVADDSSVFPYHKTNILAFDARLGAFYTISFPTSHTLPGIVDVIVTKETLEGVLEYTVVSESGDTVVDGAGDTVVVDLPVVSGASKQWKFLTIVPEGGGTYELSFSDLLTTRDAPEKFYDWYSYDNTGVSFDCYLVTGYNFAPSGPSGRKQALYLTTYMERTETGLTAGTGGYDPVNESSCTLQSRWDWTDSANANKWSAGQEIYRHVRMFVPDSTTWDDGYPVVVTRNKVRGRGRAVQLKFTADADKDMRLCGWSATLYGV